MLDRLQIFEHDTYDWISFYMIKIATSLNLL